MNKLAYTAELDTDQDTGDINCNDPRAYAAKFKTYDDNNPSFNMAMSSNDSHLWKEAIIREISGLSKQKTWGSIPRASVPKDKNGKEKLSFQARGRSSSNVYLADFH